MRGLRTFLDQFLSALRDHDRDRQGEATRASGNPGQRGAAVTAFRIVSMSAGTAVLTLTPEAPGREGQSHLAVDDSVPLAVENLRSLVERLHGHQPVAPDVLSALDDARRAGGDDGSCRIELPLRWAPEQALTVIDGAAIARHRPESEPTPSEEDLTITGHLHSIDLEPDQVAIRRYDDINWRCQYAPELEGAVVALLGEVVVAEGVGRLSGPQQGILQIRRIQAAFPELDQVRSEGTSIPSVPQGLEAISGGDWIGDEADERYLAALLERQ
jgi:hypothetical protein